MEFFIACFIFFWIWGCISDSCNGDCVRTSGSVSDLEWLCKKSKVITLTWCFMKGHATGDNGDRIVIDKSFPECIAIAAKYGFVPTTSRNDMITLVKK